MPGAGILRRARAHAGDGQTSTLCEGPSGGVSIGVLERRDDVFGRVARGASRTSARRSARCLDGQISVPRNAETSASCELTPNFRKMDFK